LLKRLWRDYLSIYVASIVAIARRKKFAFYFTTFLLALDLGSVGFLGDPLAVISLVSSLIGILLLWRGIGWFNKSYDRYDLYFFVGIILMVILYFSAWIYVVNFLPTPKEYADMVTKEAIEKGDWRVCEKLRFGQERCKLSVIAGKKDPKLCMLINSNNIRFDCYVDVAQALNNRSICDLIDEEIINEGLRFDEDRVEE